MSRAFALFLSHVVTDQTTIYNIITYYALIRSLVLGAYHAPLTIIQKKNIKKIIYQNEADFIKYMDYMNFNPVGHRFVERVIDCPYSTFHSCVKKGIYSASVENGLRE